MNLIEQLYQTLQERKSADPESSYVASLYAGGPEKMGRKITEEASEVLVEGLKGDKDKLTEEAADLIFHLWVLLAHNDIKPIEVGNILKSRMGTSGHTEKANREQ